MTVHSSQHGRQYHVPSLACNLLQVRMPLRYRVDVHAWACTSVCCAPTSARVAQYARTLSGVDHLGAHPRKHLEQSPAAPIYAWPVGCVLRRRRICVSFTHRTSTLACGRCLSPRVPLSITKCSNRHDCQRAALADQHLRADRALALHTNLHSRAVRARVRPLDQVRERTLRLRHARSDVVRQAPVRAVLWRTNTAEGGCRIVPRHALAREPPVLRPR